MSPDCELSLRMVEGALLRGDWKTARSLIADWSCPSGSDCDCDGSCFTHRGYLYNVALSVKVLGLEGARVQLARDLSKWETASGRAVTRFQTAKSSSA